MSKATVATHHSSFITHSADIYKPLFMQSCLAHEWEGASAANKPEDLPVQFHNHLLSGERQEM